ncbi:helix-turn-helix transcriptional regulator [Streptomyces sp. N50]|uniref:helix-turn-helix transcriptional regulator n=1 Tax=Streptomyces sp. N50 TaxID=3081765 RepID=UPI002961F4D6|nr:helix-turn-helix transcriptional regulator [Streptomyces sp. N50]WOX11071.1 helix-turn-helix transcriptional regulator [Streptomyces sp. N50]
MSQTRHEPVAPTTTRFLGGGETIARHRHDDHQLIYVSSGVLAITTEHGSWIASDDRAVWIPANTWHEHRFHGQSRFHTIGFPAHGKAPLLDAERPTVIAVDSLTRELIVALAGTTLTGATLTPTEARHIETVLRDRLRRVPTEPVALPAARDRRLADACRLVEEELHEPCTLAQLAARVHTSERTLSRLYRDEFGLTFPQWRTRVRIVTAMVMLAEGATVTDTAHACGWATTSAFVQTFAQTVGTTPGVYRAGMDKTAVGESAGAPSG